MSKSVQYWLMKTEPSSYSIDDLVRDQKTFWSGVRNYQARNFIRDTIKSGDLALIYHSSAEPPGVAGIARVIKEGYPDPTALDQKDDHFDPKATSQNPIWYGVGIAIVKKLKRFISLEEIKKQKELENMMVVKKGARLSIQPVEKVHFKLIVEMGRG